MKITIESIIREYLIRKSMHDDMIIETIHRLNEDIQKQGEMTIDLSDAVLTSSNEIPAGKTNCKTDASYSVLARYNYLLNKIKEENNKLINEKLDYLNYLADLKKFCGQISFVVITLEPRKSRAIKILAKGGKICEIASELDISYTTARRTIDTAVSNIAEAIDSNLKARILSGYEKYGDCFSVRG